MYLLNVKFKVPVDQLEAYVSEHVSWVKSHIATEFFLIAGPRLDKNGGIIIANSCDKDKINEAVSNDPFVKAELAEYELTGFSCAFSVSAFN